MTAAEFSLLAVSVSFIGLVLWVYWPSRRAQLNSYGAMPLEDEQTDEGRTEDRT